jgi:hypothetical protein
MVGTHAFFSDSKSGTDTRIFTAGQATAIFGAARFDLRNASMTVDEARIDVNVVFGEVEVRVPGNLERGQPGRRLSSRASTTRPSTPNPIPTSRLRGW